MKNLISALVLAAVVSISLAACAPAEQLPSLPPVGMPNTSQQDI